MEAHQGAPLGQEVPSSPPPQVLASPPKSPPLFLAAHEEERKDFVKLLEGHALWLPLVDGGKQPQVEAGKKVTYHAKPLQVISLGVKPTHDLVVFDFDVHPYRDRETGKMVVPWSPEVQMEWLTKNLGLTFEGALKVRTPSGGMHAYLLWPEGPEGKDILPGNRSFRGFSPESFRGAGLEERGRPAMSFDLRSSGVRGHVVAAGSPGYRREGRGKLLPQKQEAALLFLSLFKVSLDDVKDEDDEEAVYSLLSKDPRSPLLMKRLKAMLSRSGYQMWHEKRAAVFRALSCCYARPAIRDVWRDMSLHRDTASQGFISSRALLRDSERLSKSPHHGSYCPHKIRAPRVKEGLLPTLGKEEWLQCLYKRMKQPTSWREVQVMNYRSVFQALTRGQRAPTETHHLALAIMEDIVQPWVNHGVKNILLGEEFLKGFYQVEGKEVRKAKALLQRKGILTVAYRARQGRVASFRLHPAHRDEGLTRLLQGIRLSGGRGQATVDSREGLIYDPTTGEVIVEFREAKRKRFMPPEEDLWEAYPKVATLHEHLVGARVLREEPHQDLPCQAPASSDGSLLAREEASLEACTSSLGLPSLASTALPEASSKLLALPSSRGLGGSIPRPSSFPPSQESFLGSMNLEETLGGEEVHGQALQLRGDSRGSVAGGPPGGLAPPGAHLLCGAAPGAGPSPGVAGPCGQQLEDPPG